MLGFILENECKLNFRSRASVFSLSPFPPATDSDPVKFMRKLLPRIDCSNTLVVSNSNTSAFSVWISNMPLDLVLSYPRLFLLQYEGHLPGARGNSPSMDATVCFLLPFMVQPERDGEIVTHANPRGNNPPLAEVTLSWWLHQIDPEEYMKCVVPYAMNGICPYRCCLHRVSFTKSHLEFDQTIQIGSGY